jgi:hypothetical protein
MNVSPDQVRAAARVAAAVITQDKVPPLRLEEPPGSHERAHRTRPGWVAPLAAAAAVVIVVIGSVAGGSWLARSGNGQSSTLGSAPSAGSFTGVPPYYVMVENASLAVVRATATGATLASITTRTPFVGVTGAADDRTFVLDAQRSVMGPSVLWPGQPAFYLLRLSASGAEKSFTRLRLPALPQGTAVTGLALSPDGSKLAVEVDSGSYGRPGLLEIRVYTLAAGAFRTWFTTGSTDPVDSGGFTGSGVNGSQTISWAGNSRTLAFDWQNRSYTNGVRLLDTTASGDNLIADSRLAAITSMPGSTLSAAPGKDHVSPCVTDLIISLDGSAIVCGYDTTIGGRVATTKVRSSGASSTTPPGASSSTTGFLRYSTSTGKPSVISVFQFRGQSGGDISLYWTDPAGHTLIGGIGTPSGIRLGVINGEKFTPLPAITNLGAAAW